MTVKKDIVPEYSCDNQIRLNKYLSDAGICSRRQADRLIEEGKVVVNGKTAVTGMKIDCSWEILCEGKPVKTEDEFILLAFYKPRGIECTANPEVKNNIVDYIGYKKRIYPIGRLDKDSEGLILMTNHGDILNKIMRAGNYHEKEYLVKVDREITEAFLKQMSQGVYLKELDVTTRPCILKYIGKYTFQITLTQGLNRQIRRMCGCLGYNVKSLTRVRVMNIELDGLKSGTYREVKGAERAMLYQQCGMSDSSII